MKDKILNILLAFNENNLNFEQAASELLKLHDEKWQKNFSSQISRIDNLTSEEFENLGNHEQCKKIIREVNDITRGIEL
jgi:hypothetical protein